MIANDSGQNWSYNKRLDSIWALNHFQTKAVDDAVYNKLNC